MMNYFGIADLVFGYSVDEQDYKRAWDAITESDRRSKIVGEISAVSQYVHEPPDYDKNIFKKGIVGIVLDECNEGSTNGGKGFAIEDLADFTSFKTRRLKDFCAKNNIKVQGEPKFYIWATSYD